jgi:NADH-quinone oxidoreductase subunit N
MNLFGTMAPHLQSVVVLTAFALVLLGASNVFTRSLRATQTIAVLGALLATLPVWHTTGIGTLATLLPCCLGAIALLLLHEADLEFGDHRLDTAGLVLLGTAGAVALGNAEDLLSLMLGLETLSLCVAVLCGLGRGSRSLEASFKFFVLAAASVGVLVYGTALFAYATGSFAITAHTVSEALKPAYQVAIVLLLLGVALELAVVPLHFGALSAYMTLPTSLATFATTAGKVGAGIALLKLGTRLDPTLAGPVLLALGSGSIVWSVFAGFAQTDLRGLLAYSAIGHAGFLAIALGCGADGQNAALFYLLVYAASSALTFAGLGSRGTQPIPLSSLRKAPLPAGSALAVTAGLLSLAGMPPSPGLWAKIGVLVAAWTSGGPMVAILATLGGVFGALYYLRPVPDLLASLRRGETSRPATLGALLLVAAAVALFTVLPWMGSQVFAAAPR